MTIAGRKQVHRLPAKGCDRDVVAGLDEAVDGGRPLLRTVMENGRRLSHESVSDARARARRRIDALPEPLRGLREKGHHPVEFTDRLVSASRGGAG